MNYELIFAIADLVVYGIAGFTIGGWVFDSLANRFARLKARALADQITTEMRDMVDELNELNRQKENMQHQSEEDQDWGIANPADSGDIRK